MTRTAWKLLTALALAAPLAACSTEDGPCPTCPPDESGRIEVVVSLLGEVDSVHVTINSAFRGTVKRGRRGEFGGLARGTHAVTTVRWFENEGIVTSRTATILVRLEQGERRTLLFHNDYPLIVRAPSRAETRALALAAGGRRAQAG